MNWSTLAEDVINGYEITEEEALSILNSSDDEILQLLEGARLIRHHYYGNKVKLNMIINTKTGFCPENCGYCAQSIESTAPIQQYRMLDKETIIKGAEKAVELNSGTYCIVASGRGPTNRELDTVTSAVKEIKEKHDIKVCACLGILRPGQAEAGRLPGVDRYDHIRTASVEDHASITASDTYDDRVGTVGEAKAAGISRCSGVIVGMKEEKSDVVHMGQAVKELDADSI